MIRKIAALPKRLKFLLLVVSVVFLLALTVIAIHLLGNKEPTDQPSDPKRDVIGASTLSPNSPISERRADQTKLNEGITSIKSSIKAEKFVLKILYYRASIPYWDQQRAFASFRENVSSFDYLTLFWYTLRADGSIRKYIYAVEDKTIIDFAHKNGVKVFGLIANLPDEDEGGSWDSDRVAKVIGSSSARASHINNIVNLAEKMNFDGISIDYEELETSQKNNFTIFIRDLASALHKKGKLLGLAIHPKTSEGKPSEDNGSAAQDLLALSLAADQLYFMAYGEHWDDSDAGPIAGVPWVSRVINYALSIGVPRKKIFMGVPLYGLDWPKNGAGYGTANGLTYSEVASLLKTYNPKVSIDTIEGAAHFTYKSGGKTHEVWFENYQSIQPKLSFAKSLGISATFWRLGGEDPRIWPTLSSFR
ncbi:MAG: glycosyl hydrolase family 18 protein [Candidatus Woykebacteria bacterium]